MKEPAHRNSSGTIVPAVHLEFIQNQASVPAETGLEETETYHRALFLHHHAEELEQSRQRAQTHQERLDYLEGRLTSLHGKLTALEPWIPVNHNGRPDVEPTVPWNRWDRAMFVTAGLGIAGLMIFGVLNISFNLLESGLVTFIENPARSYFWAALLPVGALAVKVGWDLMQNRTLRRIYVWTCLGLGLAGVLVWLAAYAMIYPTLSRTTEEHLQSLSVFSENGSSPSSSTTAAPGGAKWIDAVTVVSQAAAEIFLSAVLGIYMTSLYLQHRPVRLAGNPMYHQLDEERRVLEDSVEQERAALATAKGTQSRLENELAALLSFARSLFHREANVQRDYSRQKRLQLNQISEQLRTQLAAVENGRLEDSSDPGRSEATSNRQNGS